MATLAQDAQRIMVGTVIESEHDDRAHLGPKDARIGPAPGIARKPVHVAMGAVAQKLREALAGSGNRIGPHDADRVEAMLARGVGEPRLDLQRIGQKSRLA
jgi:hypothetical protein